MMPDTCNCVTGGFKIKRKKMLMLGLFDPPQSQLNLVTTKTGTKVEHYHIHCTKNEVFH